MHPVLTVLLVLGTAILLGFLVSKLRGSSSTNSTNSGQPQVLYVPTSNTFETNTTTATITHPLPIDSSGPGPTPAPPPSPPPSPFPTMGMVRASTGSSYDKQYGGVYTFTGPATVAGGGKTDQVVPFGSSIQILGQYNGAPYGGSEGGSTSYYLTPQGYISAQDVTLESVNTGSGNYSPIELPAIFHHNRELDMGLAHNIGHHPRLDAL